jgi:4-hydroxy-tetrahydrodipicolinate synthase
MSSNRSDNLVRPEGSWVAVVTPFTNDDRLDIDGLARLVEFHVENETDGLLFLGSTGESTSLAFEEKKEIIATVAPICKGRIPAFFGVTCPTTKATVELAQFAESKGADGVMMVVPPYIAPPQDAIYDYLSTVAKSISIGVALYNNPSRVVVNIDPETVIKLCELPNVVADKEAMGNVSQIAEIISGTKGKVNVLCCDFPKYSLILPTLAFGGTGTANVAGNIIPREMAAMSRPWKSWEDVERAKTLFEKYTPIMKACYSVTNPVAVKAAMDYLGLPAGPPRPPLKPMRGEKLEQLYKLLDEFKLREKYGL